MMQMIVFVICLKNLMISNKFLCLFVLMFVFVLLIKSIWIVNFILLPDQIRSDFITTYIPKFYGIAAEHSFSICECNKLENIYNELGKEISEEDRPKRINFEIFDQKMDIIDFFDQIYTADENFEITRAEAKRKIENEFERISAKKCEIMHKLNKIRIELNNKYPAISFEDVMKVYKEILRKVSETQQMKDLAEQNVENGYKSIL